MVLFDFILLILLMKYKDIFILPRYKPSGSKTQCQ